MAVVQFKVALEPRPTQVTVYVVQAYWSDRGTLKEGRFQQFASMESALRAGQRAAVKAPFVAVSRVRGNVEADLWERPVIVAKFGSEA